VLAVIIWVMNEFKYQITQLMFLVLLGLGGYWALTHLDTNVTYTRADIVSDEEIAMVDQEPIEDSSSVDLSDDTSDATEFVIREDVGESTPASEQIEATSGNTELVSALEDLSATGRIYTNGDSGSAVETIQEFLDVYLDEEVLVDGDFGPGTQRLVREFQQAEIGGGDGRVGPNTIGEMISYLEKL